MELTYFLGPGGHRPGPCDPDIQQHFPDPAYFRFYIGHGGVLVAAVFLVVGRRIWPQPAAPVRVFLATIVFTAIAGLADILTAGNYKFLREKPRARSLLNFLGPWPWYIASGLLLAILFLIVLNAPFWFRTTTRGQAFSPLTRTGGWKPWRHIDIGIAELSRLSRSGWASLENGRNRVLRLRNS